MQATTPPAWRGRSPLALTFGLASCGGARIDPGSLRGRLASPATRKASDLSGAEAGEVARALQPVVGESDEWAWVELNYRPHAYQPPEPGGGQRPPA
jgi:hypothetical protein